jgi:uncharacterized membrane protein
MRFSSSEMTPHDPKKLPPARRRRARRLLTPLNADEQADFIDQLAQRTSPTLEYFLFSLLSGLVFCAGLLLDSRAVLLLGALLAPFLSPVVGIALGTVIGSWRFFLRNFFAFIVTSLFVLATGAVAGILARDLLAFALTNQILIIQLTWDNFLILAVGAIWTAASLAKGRRGGFVSSVALAYTLYLPLTLAGFGLTSGVPFLWPDGLVVYVLHLAWAALLGAITLAVLGFRPPTLFGYTLGGAVALAGVILLMGLTGAGAVFGAQIALPTVTPSLTPVPPTLTPTATITVTPVPPTLTPTATQTLTPEPTITPTVTPSPTPVLAYVLAPEDFGGAIMREEPGFNATIITSMSNGTLVQVLSDNPVENDNAFWVEVIDLKRELRGWMVQALLVVATPAPNWTPNSN